MKESPSISVFSTYSLDTITDKDGRVLKVQPGGPLLFLEKALTLVGADYNVFHGNTVNIAIRLNDQGETGKITKLPKTTPIHPISSDSIIISTVFKEWGLNNIKRMTSNKFFIDIQGYIRDEKVVGKKNFFNEIKGLSKNIYCLKGTREEISYLPKSVFDDQKKRLLIITDGENGIEYYSQGKKHLESVDEMIRSSDTIGAGDSFFGYFVGLMSQGIFLEKAIKIAMQKTAIFLEQKNQPTQN
jgi:hypothetical protein